MKTLPGSQFATMEKPSFWGVSGMLPFVTALAVTFSKLLSWETLVQTGNKW